MVIAYPQHGATAELPVVVLLFNNRGFGVLKPQQQVRYGRTLATDTVNPDFAMLSRGFGIRSERIGSIDELGPAVSDAIATGQSAVLEVTFDVPLPIMDPGPRSWRQKLNDDYHRSATMGGL